SAQVCVPAIVSPAALVPLLFFIVSYVYSFFLLFFFFTIPPPPRSTLFPYTTLFRSPCSRAPRRRARPARGRTAGGPGPPDRNARLSGRGAATRRTRCQPRSGPDQRRRSA